MNPHFLTDTERIDWLFHTMGNCYDVRTKEEFRAALDRTILDSLNARHPWIDPVVDFPPDETPVEVRATSGDHGVACYCPAAGDWYVHAPDGEWHGRLWSERFGMASEIIRWRPCSSRKPA